MRQGGLSYVDARIAAIRKCQPIEDWHWRVLAQEYQEEFSWVKRAFMGKFGGTIPVLPEKAPKVLFVVKDGLATESGQSVIVTERGETWQEIEDGARKIAAAIAERFNVATRPLPYVNMLWLV